MRFERKIRQTYKKNPLANVSCEIKFPPLLKLVQYGPVEFQPMLQERYPLLNIVDGPALGPTPVPQETDSSMMPLLRRYMFRSSSGEWTVSVSADALALSTSKYEKWEDFRERFAHITGAFLAVYQPSRILRVGLRYIDAIDPEGLQLPADSIQKWFNPSLLGLLTAEHVKESDVLDSQNYALLSLSPFGKLGLRWGVGLRAIESATRRVYILDGDFYDESGLAADTIELFRRLDDFNYQAGGLFQWAVLDELRSKLEPVDL